MRVLSRELVDPPSLTLSPGCVLALWPCWWPHGHAGSPMAMLVAPWPCRLPQQQGPERSPGPCVNHRLPTSPMTRSLFPDTARRQPCASPSQLQTQNKRGGTLGAQIRRPRCSQGLQEGLILHSLGSQRPSWLLAGGARSPAQRGRRGPHVPNPGGQQPAPGTSCPQSRAAAPAQLPGPGG